MYYSAKKRYVKKCIVSVVLIVAILLVSKINQQKKIWMGEKLRDQRRGGWGDKNVNSWIALLVSINYWLVQSLTSPYLLISRRKEYVFVIYVIIRLKKYVNVGEKFFLAVHRLKGVTVRQLIELLEERYFRISIFSKWFCCY